MLPELLQEWLPRLIWISPVARLWSSVVFHQATPVTLI
jgi:hypothetical protein